jgi:hypothetical protein
MKAIRRGFYWPTHIKDAEQIDKTCEACQATSPHQSKPSATVELILPTWPLQRWGIDMVGCWHFLMSLKLGCHPQHDARNVVLNKCKCSSRNKYEIRKRTDNTDVEF